MLKARARACVRIPHSAPFFFMSMRHLTVVLFKPFMNRWEARRSHLIFPFFVEKMR